MAKTNHTHRGTCQVCGRVQAIDNTTGVVAKHGYKVSGWGFFKGVCGGAGCKPAEKDLTVTHDIIAQLEDIADCHDVTAAGYGNYRMLSGYAPEITIEFGATAIRVTHHEVWDANALGKTRRNGFVSKGAYVMVAVTDETPWHKVRDAQERAKNIELQGARMARAHISMLRSKVIPRLGKPMFEGVKHLTDPDNRRLT
jgi:hypothetical protein